MIVSFDVQELEDLELLLSIAKRLGIERVKTMNNVIQNKEKLLNKGELSSHKNNDYDEINDEIDSIFGIENSNVSF